MALKLIQKTLSTPIDYDPNLQHLDHIYEYETVKCKSEEVFWKDRHKNAKLLARIE